jgi:hypothetical protein
MVKTLFPRALLVSIVFLGSIHSVFPQAPSPRQMLDAKLAPKHDDVIISTPSESDLRDCDVELFTGDTPGSSGWLLRDAQKRPLRRYFDSNGDGKVDRWSYYKNGNEVYRELDSTFKTGKPNHFRWLNEGGTKWGIGRVENGKAIIEEWRMISAEEVAYEFFQAVTMNHFDRLKALLITDAEIKTLKLPAFGIKAITKAREDARKQFDQLAHLRELRGVKFERVEGATPHCRLAEDDTPILSHPSQSILYGYQGNTKHDWLRTGEIMQVGIAWRLIRVEPLPPPSAVIICPPNGIDKLKRLQDEIDSLPCNVGIASAPVGSGDPRVDAHLRKRIQLIQKLIPLDKESAREAWYKQLLDNLASLAQNSPTEKNLDLLKQSKDALVSNLPGSNLAAYATYRDMWTHYAITMSKVEGKEVQTVQNKWLEQLGDFVSKYPKAEDTPEALWQLGIGNEFDGKDADAKRWYKQLSDQFPAYNLAPRARGCIARLDLPGKKLQLIAPLLEDDKKSFDIAKMRGKIVIIHYWASYSANYDDDFVRLKRILDKLDRKLKVRLVCVNLDDDVKRAREAVRKLPDRWTHIYLAPPNNNPGGLNSKLAIDYGIHMLPTTFLVGRDGRVVNRSVQLADIEAELKKLP